jgi:hypothetical protein
MVTSTSLRNASWLALALTACGGPDVPKTCTIDSAERKVAIVSFSNDKVDDNPLRYCVGVNVAARRDATATDPGRDDSFATMRSGVLPWTNVTFSEAAEACGRAGMFLCERRVLRTLPEWNIDPFGPGFDTTWITALSPTEEGDPADALEPISLLEERAAVAFPDTSGSVAVWTLEGYVRGRILGAAVQSGGPDPVAIVRDPSFRHPLLGFRCCVDARVQDLFEALPPDPALIRAEVDDVPIR